MKRKCFLCDATTNKPLCDFADIGWSAFSINRQKSICFCPEHSEDMETVMKIIRDKIFSGEYVK